MQVKTDGARLLDHPLLDAIHERSPSRLPGLGATFMTLRTAHVATLRTAHVGRALWLVRVQDASFLMVIDRGA